MQEEATTTGIGKKSLSNQKGMKE